MRRIGVRTFPGGPAADYRTEVRPRLQDGDVLICAGSGVFSAMIQQATQSAWSHVAFVLRLPSIDRVMLLESVEPVGVRTVRLSKYLDDYANDGRPYPGGLAVIRHRDFAALPPGRLDALAAFAVDQFGYPYDKGDVARIAARILAARVPFTRGQRERIRADREYICSEYVAACYEAAGLPVQWNRNGFVAPADFAADPAFSLVAVLQRPPAGPLPAARAGAGGGGP